MSIEVIYEGDLLTKCIQTNVNAEIHSVCSLKQKEEISAQTHAVTLKENLISAFSPGDLLVSAVGSCILIMMALCAQQNNIEFTDAKVCIKRYFTEHPIKRLDKMEIDVFCKHSFSQELRKKLMVSAESSPMISSLHPAVQKIINYYWDN